MNSGHSKRQGGMEHRIFKAVVLLLVFAFFMLIFYFIYVQLSDTFKSKDTTAVKENLSLKYFETADYKFQYTLSSENSGIQKCTIKDIYSNFISENKPCVLQTTNELMASFNNINFFNIVELTNVQMKIENRTTEYIYTRDPQYQGIVEAIDGISIPDYFKYLNYNKNDTLVALGSHGFKSQAKLFTKDLLLFCISGNIRFTLVPISQHRFIKPYAIYNRTTLTYTTIISDDDLISGANNGFSHLSFNLNENEILYIPAYFFNQYNIVSEKAVYSFLEFKSNSRVLDNMMKIYIEDIPRKD